MVVPELRMEAIELILALSQPAAAAATTAGTASPIMAWPYGQLPESVVAALQHGRRGPLLWGHSFHVSLAREAAATLRDWCSTAAARLENQDRPNPGSAKTLRDAERAIEDALKRDA